MPVKWTPALIERMFLLTIGEMSVKSDVIAQRWKDQFPDDENHPTAEAITQKIKSLKKMIGGSKAAAGTSNTNTPKSNKVGGKRSRAEDKTPTSSKNKRARGATKVKDEPAQSSDDEEVDTTTVVKRQTPTRRSKGATSYRESDENDDDDEVGEDAEAGARKDSLLDTGAFAKTEVGNLEGTGNVVDSVARSKSETTGPPMTFDESVNGDDSDISDYAPDPNPFRTV